MGISPLEDGLFVNLLIFDHLQAFCAHRMLAFGVTMLSVATEPSLLKGKGSRGEAGEVRLEETGVGW